MSQGPTAMEAGGAANVAVATTDPDFIVYLLDPEQEYNCYFVVGNPALGTPERIGVVKKMLLAHSVVFRAELQDSKIAEKKDVKLIDVFPHTFKNLLRYVYGHDNTQGLSFDEADNLLYVADKYMMSKLKNKLVTLLMSMLDCSNICSLMNNPACYNVLELNSAITDILQCETDQVLASPQFLDLSPKGFLTILEQEVLNVPEIELWRAAIEWAKNRVETENGQSLRNELDNHLQHIRVCSMSVGDVWKEVVPTKVLTYDEIIMVSESHKTGKVQPDLTTICNVIEERERPLVPSHLLTQSLGGCNEKEDRGNRESTFSLKTKDAAVELCSVRLHWCDSAHQCDCTISIQKDTEPPIVSRFEGHLDEGWASDIPILKYKKNVRLSPNSTYLVKCTFSCSLDHCGFYQPNPSYSVPGSHFSVKFQCHSNGRNVIHFSDIKYKTLSRDDYPTWFTEIIEALAEYTMRLAEGVGSESGQSLRDELNDHLKHIRVCSVTSEDMFEEVLPTEVLTYGELKLVSKSRKTRKIQPDLTTICNVVEERERPLVTSELLTLDLTGYDSDSVNIRESTFTLNTKDNSIELCSVHLYLCGSDHQCDCTVTIQRGSEPPIVSRFEGQLNRGYGNEDIPVLVDEKNVRLSPNSTYSVKCTFSCSSHHFSLCRQYGPNSVSGNHFTVDFQLHSSGKRIFHFNDIKYRALTKRLKTRQR